MLVGCFICVVRFNSSLFEALLFCYYYLIEFIRFVCFAAWFWWWFRFWYFVCLFGVVADCVCWLVSCLILYCSLLGIAVVVLMLIVIVFALVGWLMLLY